MTGPPAPGNAHDRTFASIADGESAEHRYVISEAVYAQFLAAFGDRSPIHVDDGYARAAGFDGRVAHGAILNGFVSHFIGMVLPGKRSLLLSVDLRYAQPCHIGDAVVLTGTVSQKVDAQQVVVLTLRIRNETRGTSAATGRAQVRVRDT